MKQIKLADVDKLSKEVGTLSKEAQLMVTALAAAAATGVPNGAGGAGGADVLITVDNTDKMPAIADVLKNGFVAGAKPVPVKANKVGKQLSVDFGG